MENTEDVRVESMYGVKLKGFLPRKILTNLKFDLHCSNKYDFLLLLQKNYVILVSSNCEAVLRFGVKRKVLWYLHVKPADDKKITK